MRSDNPSSEDTDAVHDNSSPLSHFRGSWRSYLSTIAAGILLGVVIGSVLSLGFGASWLPVGFAEVSGHSMDPTLADGSFVMFTTMTDVDEGDIIIFWSPTSDDYIIHRVERVSEGRYITQGDNNGYTDQDVGFRPVPKRAVRGEAILEIHPTRFEIEVFG